MSFAKGTLFIRGSVAERFWPRVNAGGDGCWEWNGKRDQKGYGKFGIDENTNSLAHRTAWELANAEKIPDGVWVLHSCDNPPCCNPAHLRLGNNSDNMRDAVSRGRNWNTRKTHCAKGHEYTPENILWSLNGRNKETKTRQCRECGRARSRIQNAKRRAS